jgi:branched-chain amino acid transport system substrate-binding protein
VLTSLPGGDDDAIKIGFIYSSANRSHSLNGAEMAERKLNAEGGVHGTPIKVIARGNITSNEHAAEIAEALIAEGISAIIGPNLSRYAVPIGEVAQQHEIPMVTTTATNPTVTAAGDFVFMSAFTDDFQGKVMARFAAQDLGAKTAAVLTRSESLYSGGLSQTFIDNFTASGGEVVGAEFYARGDTDFTALLTTIAESAPDVFFSAGILRRNPASG